MVAATSVMKPPPTRVGNIANGVTLPRPVQLKVLLAAIGGGVFGVIAALVLGAGLQSLMWSIALFGGIGILAVTYSPLQGESLSKWLALTIGTRRRANFTVDGRPARVAVGIAPVHRPVAGRTVRLQAGAVRVPPASYDERGVRLPSRPMPVVGDLKGDTAAPLGGVRRDMGGISASRTGQGLRRPGGAS
jgi:hypothetical protein